MGGWHRTLGFVLLPERRDLLVDEASLLDVPGVGTYDVDVVELARAACGVGPAWVLTCDCGIPACAGLGGPVAVRNGREGVVWTLPPPLARTYVFDPDALRRTVREAFEAARGVPRDLVRSGGLIAQQRYTPWHEAVALALAEMDAPQPTPYAGD